MDRLDSLPGACSLESENGQKRRPACVRNRLGEVVIPDHVGDPQIFMINRIVLARQLERRLVMEVLSLAAYCLMRLGKNADCFTPAIAPLLSLRDAPLAFREIPFCLTVAAGREDARPIG